MHSLSVVLLVAVCFLAAGVSSAPQLLFGQPGGPVPIVQKSDVRDEAGQFSLGYTSGDGTNFQEQGVLKRNTDGDGNVLVYRGRYTYTSPEGKLIEVSYTADENGFQVDSPSLPIAPTA